MQHATDVRLEPKPFAQSCIDCQEQQVDQFALAPIARFAARLYRGDQLTAFLRGEETWNALVFHPARDPSIPVHIHT